MKKLQLVAIILISSVITVFAQNDGVQIDHSVSPPVRSSSAALEVNSANQGVLVPRLNTAQRTGIVSPANGLLVYDTNLRLFYYYDTALPGWVAVGTGSGSLTSFTADNGLTSGGTSTDPTVKLGGPLTQATTITQDNAGETFTIVNNTTSNTVVNLQSTGDFDVQKSGTSSLFVGDNGSVGISSSSPNASAILDIVSTNKGILIPRMNYTQEQAIATPANGLMVFNITSNCLDIFTGGAWQSIYCSCPILQPLNPMTGNTPVCSGTNQTYSVPSITGASNYAWTVTGSPVITGNGSNIISFNAPALSTYTVSVTASNACNTSSVTQTKVVNAYTAVPPTPAFSSTPAAICQGGSYNYTITNGLGNNGTTAITYTWTITATGTASATLTANSLTASAGTPVVYTAAATGITLNMGTLGSGNIVVSVVGNNTCGASVTPLSLTQAMNINSIDPTSATVSTATICNGSATTLTLNGGGGGTGEVIKWYTGSCGSTLAGTGNNLSVSPIVTTTYYGRYEDPAPCSFNTNCQSVTVTVNQFSVAPTSISGTTPICNGGSTTLTAVGGTLGTGANYQWGTGAVVGTSPLAGQTASTLTVSPTTTNTYWVRIENTTAPCTGTTGGVTRVITVNQPSVAPTSVTLTTPICNGGSTTLTVVGGTLGTGANYQWGSGAVVGTSPLAGQTASTLTVSPTSTTTYWVRIENTTAPCTGTTAGITQAVTVNQPSVAPASISGTGTICTGNSTVLTAVGGTLGTGANYQWGTGAVVGTSPLAGQTGITLTTSPTSNTTYWVRIENTSSPCTGSTGGVTRAITVDALSVLGTVSNAGPIDFCESTGNWSAVPISVSGQTGSVMWQFGSSSGGWSADWSGGTSPGYCCFPKKVAVSDGAADRVRWYVTNGVCPATTFSTPVLLRNRYNEAPTSLASNQNNYCINSVATITLTATFPTATDILGNVEFYSGSCAGTLVATVAGNGTTTVPATITAPTTSTTYYVRYNPGTGTGCSATACVSTTVNVTQIPANPGFGNGTWNVTAYNGGTIDLSGTYYGYYTEPLLNYTTLNRWCNTCSPSDASGWQGCVVPADNHVVVSKRTGFTCGYYRLDITDHDDQIRVYVNGTQVFEHINCCDAHTNIWTGYLTSSSTIEVRHYEGGGGSSQSLTINPTGTTTSIAPTSITGTTTICTGSSTTLTQSGGTLANNANYVWYTGGCGVTNAGTGNSITVTPGSNTTYYVRAEGTCNTTGCASTTVTLDATSVLGTISNAGPIDFCSSTGDWSAVPVSVSGNVGTVTWDWGNSAGGWNVPWVNGTSPGYCCFPTKVSSSDGNADRVRWSTKNGTCPATGYSASLLLRNHYSPAPSTLASNQNSYCSGSIANITLTATFATNTSILGNVQFYSGSCGGTLVATVAGNGTTSVAATITAPTSTTNYYALYNPGTGTGCSSTGCAGTTVTVNNFFTDPGAGSNIWNVVGYNGGNINLSGTCYGYYTESSLTYNSLNRWGTNGSPSDASGWQGCYVPVDNHVVVSKRTGFPSGTYTLDMPNHDDDVRLYVNGALVWSHEPGCCDAHTAIWGGTLNATSTVEVRHLEGGGGSHQSLTFNTLPAQCTSYTTINDNTRATTYTGWVGCDNGLASGWYRISGSYTTIPNAAPANWSRCGTSATGWLNFANPGTAGTTTSGSACWKWTSSTCQWSTAGIQITNCNGYYVYYLNPVTWGCDGRYCVQ